jgi:flagellar protein FlgJ
MTLPVNNGIPAATGSSADVYNDFAGLAALKKSARTNDPAALRQVAKQYEGVFARMMIKSMRDAVGKDPIFGSDEGQSYQEMYDDQLSLELTKGKGLGLADMLVQQIQRLKGGDKNDAAQAISSKTASQGMPGAGATAGVVSKAALRLFKENAPRTTGVTGASASSASPEAQSSFISELWPTAQQAGQQLGVDPRNLIAQAALETNWGTHVPSDSSGRSSNNLFGMKTGGQWNGATVTAGTQEYENGSAVSTTGQFRAYGSRAQSFQDYVALLRNNPRYTAALNTGSDAHAFATALQQGGYATDPDYASKIATLAARIGSREASRQVSLKSASAQPINPNTGIL